jgi:iron complex transport system substrate-binding protein
MRNYLLVIIVSLGLFSCDESGKSGDGNISEEVEVTLKYAEHFKIFSSGKDYRIQILDRDKVIQEFRVSKYSKSKGVLKIPFTKFVATSTTHLGYIEFLGLRDGLVGFPNTNFISDSLLHSMAENNQIAELGTAESMNFEKLFELNPNVIFDFPNPISIAQKDKFEKAGMQLIKITEFYEESALGKVEWIKLFGLLLGREDLADRVFRDIETRFLKLKNSVVNKRGSITVFSGIMFGDTWYAPGGRSFAAKFYKMAGADYVWASDSSSGSRSFSFEKVYKDAVDADYWIGVGGQESLSSLKKSNSNYELFKAFRNKNVYSVFGKNTAWGANAYFEKGVMEPDVVLQDLIRIFDSNSENAKLVYHRKLE